MEEKINVAKILKDKPKGTKLYSDICCGECFLNEVSENAIYVDMYNKERFWYFSVYGTIYAFQENGGVLLYPSYEMRDWNKFAWKKGDVLKNTAYEERVIFDGFLNDDYTYFKGKHPLDCSNKLNITYHEECNCFTGNYRLESTDAAQTYIKTIEEKLDGILNLESLEIENAHPEYKDGDIVYMGNAWNEYIGIIKNRTSGNQIETYAHCHKDSKEEAVLGLWLNKNDSDELRLATNSEKQQLFDALAEEGKAWDSDKKQIVDLPKKCEFKVFEKVLVRESKTDEWTPNFFFKIHRDDERYVMVCGDMYNYCIPYNEETSHLLGTTDEWKGGEG